MADSAQVKELTAKLEQGVQDLFNSKAYANYLKTMSRFHNYSTRNTMLIHMQKSGATLVAGFNSWQTNFNRRVKKGEKAIKIFAPIPLKITKELEKIDPITQRPIIGEDGEPLREEIEIKMARFKVVNVFDASQTEGEPLPSLVQDITGNVEQYEAFVDALRAVSPLPITFKPMPDGIDGECIYGDKIIIREGMSEIQTVSAIIHEIAHAELHDMESIRQMGGNAEAKDLRTKEVEAESVSYAVCQYFNIDTGMNSFGYIAEWSEGRELKELNASLDTIRKTTGELIDGIDGKFQELVKERNIVFAVGDIQIELAEPPTFAAKETSALIESYAQVANPQRIGASVLMTPVFDNGNFNHTGKKIRVVVEEPIGKYQIYSHEANDYKQLYFQTASGRIDRMVEYFQDEWNEDIHKWVRYRPTETELDEIIPQIAAQFERDMADPTKWAKYQHAAVVNRLDECEAHNAPIRERRNAESEKRREEAELSKKEDERLFQEKFDSRVDEIANAMVSGTTISVGYDEYAFGGKNPVLDLFKLYDIKLPLRTQGWVNTGLAEITDGGYRYFSNKHKRNSSVIGGYLKQLRDAIKLTPIEQKRGISAAKAEVMNMAEEKSAKKYDLGYGFLGNGISVWNRAEEKNGEYTTVAHIGTDRSVTFYDNDMPHEIKQQIENVANSPDTRGFGFSPPPETTEPKNLALLPSLLPDPTIDIATMNAYGYDWEGMLPLTESWALELYDSNNEVYLLYPDNTEGMALDRDEIANHDGIFGIEVQDWERTPYYAKQLANVANEESLSQLGTRQEERTGTTVAELEVDVKAGKVISRSDLAKAVHAEKKPEVNRNGAPKPKLLERLEQGKQKAAQQKQTSTPNLNERSDRQ